MAIGPSDLRRQTDNLFSVRRVTVKIPAWLDRFTDHMAKFYGCSKSYFWMLMCLDYVDRKYGHIKDIMTTMYMSSINQAHKGSDGVPVPPTPFDDRVLKSIIRSIEAEQVLKMRAMEDKLQVVCIENTPRHRVELHFRSKPDQSTVSELRDKPFGWVFDPLARCWHGDLTDENVALAHDFCDRYNTKMSVKV